MLFGESFKIKKKLVALVLLTGLSACSFKTNTSQYINEPTHFDNLQSSKSSQATNKIQGLEFNPQVYNPWGGYLGNLWFSHFHDKGPGGNRYVKQEVEKELDRIKNNLKVTDIVLFFSSVLDFDWPQANAQQLKNLNELLTLIHSKGFNSILFIGNPGCAPNSVVKNPVGGHKKGDVVNGHKLYWDVPYFAENTYIPYGKQFYSIIFNYLEKNLSTYNKIQYIGLAGNPNIPFVTEFLLYKGNDAASFRGHCRKYLKEVTTHLKEVENSQIPIGITTLARPEWKTSGPEDQFAYLSYLFEKGKGLDISRLDYLDITSFGGKLDFENLKKHYPSSKLDRVIISDFKLDGEAGSFVGVNNLNWNFREAQNHGFGGWWIWQFNDLRTGAGGVRWADTGKWKYDYVEAINEEIDRALREDRPVDSRSLQIVRGGTGCKDNYCIYLNVKNFDANTCVELSTVFDRPLETLCTPYIRASEDSIDKATVTLKITSDTTKWYLNEEGVKFNLLNPSGEKSNPYVIQRGLQSSPTQPTILQAGTGCEDHYCIYIVAKDILENECVELRSIFDQPLGRLCAPQIKFKKVGSNQSEITLRVHSHVNQWFLREEGLHLRLVDSRGKGSNTIKVQRNP